ncbi:hypothetical protein OEA41_007301 [Lepraria neglecta]|uniref:Uncharacterized protein n=1 Tax=Lepraria neglecta TaxID=209136 RepID=A0AAE0DMX7_9LECA|nr:hypothetical protein OEA41_007301 [Lepraria neglecta]
MAHATPTRRALVDLPVNSFSTPSAVRAMGKKSTGNKRRIHEVEEPESAQPTSRVSLSPARSASTLKKNNPREEARLLIPSTSREILTPNPANAMTSNTAEPTEELGEGDSQHSYKDFMSSLIDFDPDETLTSQQTAATELTQPSPSRVGRVSKRKGTMLSILADHE